MLRVSLASGRRLIYKPRSVGAEAWWRALVDALPELDLVAPRVLARSGYGWVEAIRAVPLRTVDLASYLERAGASLALLDLFEVRDAHRGNVLTAGGRPVLVDAETIAHPRFFGGETLPSAALAGFLPWPRRPGGAPPGLDPLAIAALGGVRSRGRLIDGYRAGWTAVRPIAGDAVRQLVGLRTRVVLRSSRDYAQWLRRPTRPLSVDLPVPGRALGAVLAAETSALGRGDLPCFHVAASGRDLLADGRRIARQCFPRSGLATIGRRLARPGSADQRRSIAVIESCLTLGLAVGA